MHAHDIAHVARGAPHLANNLIAPMARRRPTTHGNRTPTTPHPTRRPRPHPGGEMLSVSQEHSVEEAKGSHQLANNNEGHRKETITTSDFLLPSNLLSSSKDKIYGFYYVT